MAESQVECPHPTFPGRASNHPAVVRLVCVIGNLLPLFFYFFWLDVNYSSLGKAAFQE